MFGFACDETDVLMPLPIHLAHRLVEHHAELRQNGKLKWLRPDAKSQVTIEYEDEQPVAHPHRRRLDAARRVACSTRTTSSPKKAKQADHREGDQAGASRRSCGTTTSSSTSTRPGFVVGGPHGDSGLTGRKIIVDSYGGRGGHGGGAFSGKDPTKVDRSRRYMARYIAKNIVAAGLAESAKCSSPTRSASPTR